MNDLVQNTIDNIDWVGPSWVYRPFSYPNRTVRLATSFSGIGAIEYALKRLGVKTKIVFAGDINKNCKAEYFANYNKCYLRIGYLGSCYLCNCFSSSIFKSR